MTPKASLAQATDQASAFVAAHRRGIVVTSVALLAGCAAAAFAIAPLAPDAAALPQRLVVEAVRPQAFAPQLEALAAHKFDLSRADLTRTGDTPGTLLERLGVADASAVTFLRSDANARRLFEGRGGRLVQVRTGEDGRLKSLVARSPALRSEQVSTHFTRLTVARNAQEAWQAVEETLPLQSQTRLAGGTIRSSLFAASDEARIPDAIAVQIAEIFAADIDMHRELRRGDTFSVVYEALTADGEPIPWSQGTGRVLAAEFVNGGKSHQAVWYRDANGRGSYFDLTGQSKKRTFLASPMEFSRMSSGFAMRFHPLLQKWRAHLGVDYAAPTGTTVRTVGDGVVEFAGWQNGYGNVVQIKHSNERSTLYAHLSRIDVKKGQRTEQGQRVGAVGSTGWSTGPHLHFEFRVNGQHQDPLRIAKASEAVAIAPTAKAEFAALAQTLQVNLDVAETLVGARGRGE
ncbi:MAG: peptidoglycan DD-metalloendopeptidase family protein [Burkholderiaceae bacterium]|nr:peptidoglycan DD-metalloendopeptidase family protein [Burkholderiaceae bacterium]